MATKGRGFSEAHRLKTKFLSKGEIKNGWTFFTLQKHIKEDDEALNRKLGLGGRAPVDLPHYGSDYYDPLDW